MKCPRCKNKAMKFPRSIFWGLGEIECPNCKSLLKRNAPIFITTTIAYIIAWIAGIVVASNVTELVIFLFLASLIYIFGEEYSNLEEIDNG